MESLVVHSRVQVLVVPFGTISVSKFKEYLSYINRWREIPLLLVQDTLASLESLDDIDQDGVMRFNFTVRSSEDLGEDQSMGQLGLHSLQAHQRCAAIIGICDCPSTTSLSSGLQTFQSLVEKYPGTALSSWFAFRITEEQSTAEDVPFLFENGMNPIYPENVDLQVERVMCNLTTSLLKQFDSIIKDARDRITQLEQAKASDNKSKIISRMRSRADSYLSMLMSGATYPGDNVVTTKQSEAKSRKRQLGRLQAWIGGYALLAGSPRDALTHYNKAILNCSAAGDPAWQGISLEGSASALFLQMFGDDLTPRGLPGSGITLGGETSNNSAPAQLSPDPTELDGKQRPRTNSASHSRHATGKSSNTMAAQAFVPPGEGNQYLATIPDVKAALLKAATLYAKVDGFWSLEANVTIKLANYMSLGPHTQREETIGLLTKLLRKAYKQLSAAQAAALHRSPSGSTADDVRLDQMERDVREIEILFRDICIQSAVLFSRFGLSRKSSFLLQQASQREANWNDSFVLLQMAAEGLGIRPKYSVEMQDVREAEKDDSSTQAWMVIQQHLLQALAESAQNAGKPQLAIDYALQLMEHADRDRELQLELREMILACVNVGGFCYLSTTCCFPSLINLELMNPRDNLVLHKRKIKRKTHDGAASPVNASPLFYSPFDKEDTTWSSSSTDSAAGSDHTSWNPAASWVQNEIASVTVHLENPTPFPIIVDAIHLDITEFSDDQHVRSIPELAMSAAREETIECHRAAVKLGPHERSHKVILSARPLKEGRYVIHGCVISAMGLISLHTSPLRAVQIEVVKPMPYVNLQSSTHGEGLRAKNTLVMYDGEIFPLNCDIHQTSVVQATDYKLDATVSFEPPSSAAYKQAVVVSSFQQSSVDAMIEQIKSTSHIRERESGTGKDAPAEAVSEYLITSSSAFPSQLPRVLGVVKGLEEANIRLRQAVDQLDKYSFNNLSVPIRFSVQLEAKLGCRNASFQLAYTAGDLPFERRQKLSFDMVVQPALKVAFLAVEQASAFVQDPLDVMEDVHGSSILLICDIRNFSSQEEFTVEALLQESMDTVIAKQSILPASMHRLLLPVRKDTKEDVADVAAWFNSKVHLRWATAHEPRRFGLLRVDADVVVSEKSKNRLNNGGLALNMQRVSENELEFSVSNVSTTELVFEGLSVSVGVLSTHFQDKVVWSGSMMLDIAKLAPKETVARSVWFQTLDEPKQGEERHLDLVLHVLEETQKARTWSLPFRLVLS